MGFKSVIKKKQKTQDRPHLVPEKQNEQISLLIPTTMLEKHGRRPINNIHLQTCKSTPI